MMKYGKLAVFADIGCEREAYEAAQKLNAEYCSEKPETAPVLCFGADGISLSGGGQVLRCDLTHMVRRLRYDNLTHELTVRAAKLKSVPFPLTLLDATAGFGEDSLLLAAAGYDVTLYEYDPTIALLLADGLRRASLIQELSEAVKRMTLVQGDSVLAMHELDSAPDVIMLDPMFPARQKSALVKKKFQLLHMLEEPCGDEQAMLEAAIGTRARKVIVKRPAKGQYLAGVKPDYSVTGKSVRFDCYVK
ncbi:MAG TPA: class I SAM-dependent methyltransferase [Bacillota bacterium]|nr:class I SAM-dependent methyltransferase [Bacillota bacterium]